MKKTLYAVYNKTVIPDEMYSAYNAGYNKSLIGYLIVGDEEQGYPIDPEYELVPLGLVPSFWPNDFFTVSTES